MYVSVATMGHDEDRPRDVASHALGFKDFDIALRSTILDLVDDLTHTASIRFKSDIFPVFWVSNELSDGWHLLVEMIRGDCAELFARDGDFWVRVSVGPLNMNPRGEE